MRPAAPPHRGLVPDQDNPSPAHALTFPRLSELQLPSEYPFKPPEVYMLTPSGRFEVNKKICLSISSFHPYVATAASRGALLPVSTALAQRTDTQTLRSETWQPSWGIRTALVALMAFFESEVRPAEPFLLAPRARSRLRSFTGSRRGRFARCSADGTAKDGPRVPDAPVPDLRFRRRQARLVRSSRGCKNVRVAQRAGDGRGSGLDRDFRC